MFLVPISIDRNSYVTDIVKQDYRTASVFTKYDIDFCCGKKWPLGKLCEMQKLDFELIKEELENSVRTFQLSNSLRFTDWSIDFLTEYIINVHHQYLVAALPRIHDYLSQFVKDHKNKYPELEQVLRLIKTLSEDIIPHMKQEEEILFPYICQMSHAYESKESYASLFVRTLRKPVEKVIEQEHETILKIMDSLRTITHNYTPAENTCISYQVAFSLLKELDQDLMQHVFLETEVLFRKQLPLKKN